MSNWNLEVSAELAESVENCLREFGQDAELDLALLVDDSGAMIAGVASRQNVDVATVGVMVATTYSGVRSLSKSLGDAETGDCVIHGSGNNIYLRSVAERFVLLGVSELTLPIGVIREKAAQICGALEKLLAPLVPESKSDDEGEETPELGLEDASNGDKEKDEAASDDGEPEGDSEKATPKYVFEIG